MYDIKITSGLKKKNKQTIRVLEKSIYNNQTYKSIMFSTFTP